MSAMFVVDSGCDLHVFASARHASGVDRGHRRQDGEYPPAHLHGGVVPRLTLAG